jgi:hypothetical protein
MTTTPATPALTDLERPGKFSVESVNAAQRRPRNAGLFWQNDRRVDVVDAQSAIDAVNLVTATLPDGWRVAWAEVA